MNTPSILLAAAEREVLRSLMPEFPRGRFTPMAGHSGSQVAQSLQTRKIEAAVVHHTLADMSGEAFCKWLRESYGEQLAIVLLVDKLPPRRRGKSPFDATLRYPAGPGVLGDRIGALLRQKASASGGLARFEADVKARIEALERQDYYATLGLSRTAKYDTIRAAYDQLSLQYHPDKHLSLKDTPLHKSLGELYKRIGEGYRVLTDPKKKKEYDRALAKGKLRLDDGARESDGPKALTDLSDSPRVKRFLKLAQVSVASGNVRAALQNLRFAKSLEPKNELLKAKIAELEKEK